MASSFDKLDLSILVPKGQEKRLAWLGKHNWLRITPRENAVIELKVLMPAVLPWN